MTVSELIERLKSIPDQSLPVLVRGYEGGAHDLTSEFIQIGLMARNVREDDGLSGEHEFEFTEAGLRNATECVDCAPNPRPFEIVPALMLNRESKENYG